MAGPCFYQKPMDFLPNFWTTTVGSFPDQEGKQLSRELIERLDVPVWPQLPRRSFRENMYVQFSRNLPGIREDVAREKVFFDTSGDLSPELEGFYERYLLDNVESFALHPADTAGFYHFLNAFKDDSSSSERGSPRSWVKGQVTGPVSFGLTITDQDLRASLYNETLVDVIVKNLAMNARWQVRQLRQVRPNVIIFVDEPYLSAFGSAFISLSREQVIGMLDEVFDAIHLEGGLAGVHCCGNTDWSVLLATKVDILNLDANEFLENLALYPAELNAYLEKGGAMAWGIVPNTEEIREVTSQGMAERLLEGFVWITEKAQARGVTIRPEALRRMSLVTPSCGLGPTSVEISREVLAVLEELGNILREAAPA